MTTNESRLAEANSAHIGEGVTFKGSITVPDVIVVDGVVEGDITARTVRVGVSGSIKGTVTSIDAEVHGRLCDKVEVKEFLLVRSTGRIEGSLAYGDVQVERGAVLSANVSPPRSREEAPRSGADVQRERTDPPAVDAPKFDPCEGRAVQDQACRRRIAFSL